MNTKEIVRLYLEQMKSAKTHPAKTIGFSSFLSQVFGVELEDLLPGVEYRLNSKIAGIKGKADLLFGDVVVEMKVSLAKEIDDAKNQLQNKYFQPLIEENPKKRYVGIVTDGILFEAYLPVLENEKITKLKEIGKINVSKCEPKEFLYWLDAFLFSKEGLKPTAEDLKWTFGPGSPTYETAVEKMGNLWTTISEKEESKLKFELWKRYMQIVYGTAPEVGSFIEQTYLVTLVKIIVFLKLKNNSIVDKREINNILNGEYFVDYGISNMIEEDFFSWIVDERIIESSLEIALGLVRGLRKYDMKVVDEDLFKEIYQEIVKRSDRHRIGEYYTPEWLVEVMFSEVMQYFDKKKLPKILDPACGSGTFIVEAVRLYLKKLSESTKDKREILNSILENITGYDIHPLASMISKANYVITLRELLTEKRSMITIPIFVADSVKIPSIKRTAIKDLLVRGIEANGENLEIPERIVKDKKKLGMLLKILRDSIELYKQEKDLEKVFAFFESRTSSFMDKEEFEVTKTFNLEILFRLFGKGRDSIWLFVFSNMYAPVMMLDEKCDVLIGNPPWIAMRYIENKEYQDFLKSEMVEYDLISKKDINLFTHMEMATLFFCRTCDLYLKPNGMIAFVMPRSVLTGAMQHERFKKFNLPAMKLLKIVDTGKVKPLFRVPSCVLIASKGEKTVYPVETEEISGRLERENVKLSEAFKTLVLTKTDYSPPEIPQKPSIYRKRFRQGATLVPRNFWFIEFVRSNTLGMNIQEPLLRTSKEITKNAKEPWKNIILEGSVESDYIYATLLGGDLMPFGFTGLRPVVLPLTKLTTSYMMLTEDSLERRGSIKMRNWLKEVQKHWEDNRTEKAKTNFPEMILRLDYHNLLTSQNPGKKYAVLYTAVGKNIASCVINKENLPDFHGVTPKGFIADHQTYIFETNKEDEAHYLCAILNSNVINEAIKSSQTKGAYGERHIHNRPLMFPIPEWNSKDSIQRRLVSESKKCHEKVRSIQYTQENTARKRKETRDSIKEYFKTIDSLVRKMIDINSKEDNSFSNSVEMY